MKFARYWHEIKVPVDEKVLGSPTVSIWGYAEASLEAAANNAQQKVETFKRYLANNLRHDEAKAYHYWSGLIREEIVDEITDGDGRTLAVISRNAYGALVLNSEAVLFGDIDMQPAGFFAKVMARFGRVLKDKAYYLREIQRFQKFLPDYTYRVYETAAGLRFVIVNATFAPHSNDIDQIFSALDVDPLYRQLCRNQVCFRARLSPKPWRIGVERPTVRFPRTITSEQTRFQQWLKQYQEASSPYSVARWLETIGDGEINPDVQRVLEIHDSHCCSREGKLA